MCLRIHRSVERRNCQRRSKNFVRLDKGYFPFLCTFPIEKLSFLKKYLFPTREPILAQRKSHNRDLSKKLPQKCGSFSVCRKSSRRGDHRSPADFAKAKSVAVRRKSCYFPSKNPKNFVFRRAIIDRPYIPRPKKSFLTVWEDALRILFFSSAHCIFYR